MPWRSIEDALAIGYGIERSFVCHVHPDTNASASVNAVTGLWVCYACGGKGKVDPEHVIISPDTVVREVNKALANIEGGGHQYYPESWLSLFDGAGPGQYWQSRFSLEACRHFRLGYDAIADAAVYPLRDTEGRVLGMVQRTLKDDDSHQKYKYPLGSNTSDLLFGYHEAEGDEIVLVEGATDAVAAWESGERSAMALYGSRLSWAQKKLLWRYNPKTIWVATDQDRSGNNIADILRYSFPHVDVRRMRWDGAKDLASISTDLRTEVLAQARQGKVVSVACGSPHGEPQHSSGTSTPRRLRIKLSST